MIRCQRHPTYAGIRKLRRSKDGTQCADCLTLYEANKAAGLKEERKRQVKLPVPTPPNPVSEVSVPPLPGNSGDAPVPETPFPVPEVDAGLSGGLGQDEFDISKGDLDEVL